MNRRHFLGGLAGALGALSLKPASLFAQANAAPSAAPKPAQTVTGTVFHDRDGSGIRRIGAPGVPNVAVSNGREVVLTDAAGRYNLPVSEGDIVFVIKPRGWASPLNAQKLPQNWRAHKPSGSPTFKYLGHKPTGNLPASMDFPLRPQAEGDAFKALLFGDPQPRNVEEIDYTMRDILCDLQGVDAAFGLSLGDVMFNNLEFYPQLNDAFATLGIPWHHTAGNHDLNFDAPDNSLAVETFESIYGPSNTAFNYGPVHFIVLNNVVWSGAGNKNSAYTAGLNAKQLAFVENDLKHVPREKLVVVAMHIPMHQAEMEGREALYRILEARPNVLALSAHTHVQYHEFLGEAEGWKGAKPLHHLNHATVCGSWWSGAPDEIGVPHATMSDGAPNGYSFLNFDGSNYTIDFHGARQGSQQMKLWAPDQIKKGEATEIVANVFAGSEKSKVEVKFGASPWAEMKPSKRPDPYYEAMKALEEGPKPPPGRKLPKTDDSRHIWATPIPANLPSGTHTIEVRSTDMWGRVHSSRKLLRVV